MKKGFTLIELLAVLTVLSIILLITIPIMNSVIKNSKEKTKEQSVTLYGRALENAINNYYVKYPLKNEVTLKELEDGGFIEYKGNKVECNIVRIEERDVYLEGCKVENKRVDTTYGKYIPATITDDDYRGYYADVDGDGNPDGIIYADLTHSSRENAKWGPGNNGVYEGNGEYSYTAQTDLKKYIISDTKYTGENAKFGKKEIISVKKGSSGNDRFYVMALTNFTTEAHTDPNNSNNNYPAYTTYYWYYNAYGKMPTPVKDTKLDFGTGYVNTGNIIEIWNKKGIGEESYLGATQDNQDIWKHIQKEYAKGWYIPSHGEWVAFADYFEVTSNNDTGSYVINSGNYNSTYGLSPYYWSSSQNGTGTAWLASFDRGYIYGNIITGKYSIRLGANF